MIKIEEIESKVRCCPYFDAVKVEHILDVQTSEYMEEGVEWNMNPTRLYNGSHCEYLKTADRIINRNRVLRSKFSLNHNFFREILSRSAFKAGLAKYLSCFGVKESVIARHLGDLLKEITGEVFFIVNTDQYYSGGDFPPLGDSICLTPPTNSCYKMYDLRKGLWVPPIERAVERRTIPWEYHKCIVDETNVKIFEVSREDVEKNNDCPSLSWRDRVSSSFVYGKNPTAWHNDKRLYAHLAKETGKVKVSYQYDNGGFEAPIEVPIREFLIFDFDIREK